SLQQNLNEYVEALITLKQKIINTDNLLTEYQKKCDELQFARRENSMLHHQVEQMLQKISPLQKCQEELDSLKAELEEKKSSLKLYQNTHQEYARVKEECLRSDAQKKKLEAKVKKLEEAAVKQTQDFKQLRNEKKILEKEFKKTQERLDEVSKQKNEKELRHVGTQISSDSYGSVDKRKVKLLLKELWLCVNTAHRLPGEGSRHVPEKPSKGNRVSRHSGEDDALPPAHGSPAGPSDVHTCLTKLSMEIEGDYTSCDSAEGQPGEAGPRALHAVARESRPEVSVQTPEDEGRTSFADHGHVFDDDDLQAAIEFFKLPPPLLSPVPSPPPVLSPHLGPLPSALAPETYFGECADSSDGDSAPLRNSAESALEEDTAESQGYFGLFGKNKRSDKWAEKPRPQEAVQSLSAFALSRGTHVGFDTLRAALEEPAATLAQGRQWPSPGFLRAGERDTLDATERQAVAGTMAASVQAGEVRHQPTGSVCAETASGSLSGRKQAVAGESKLCFSPLGKRMLSELRDSEGKTLLSAVLDFAQPVFTKRTLKDETASEPHRVTGSGRFQRKEREDVQRSTLESPEPQAFSPRAAVCAGVSAGLSSSSASGPVSAGSDPQSSRLECVGIGTPARLFPMELQLSDQKSQPRTSNTFLLHSEPPERSLQEDAPESSSYALSPKLDLGTSDCHDQKNSKVERLKLKGVTRMSSLPQSVFQKAAESRRCKGQDPGAGLAPHRSDLAPLASSQASWIRRGSASVKNPSWHQSEILRRGGKDSPRATSGHAQETGLHLETAAPASQSSRFTTTLEPRESAILLESRAAALLPNQVSVITKQAGPKKAQSTSLERGRPRGNEPASATDNHEQETSTVSSIAKSAGDRDAVARNVGDVAVERSPSPEVSTSWRKPDLDSPSGSLATGNFDDSTDSKLSFSSEDSLVPSQDAIREPSLQGGMHKPPESPCTTVAGTSRLESGGLLPTEVAVPGDCPTEQAPPGDTRRLSTEARGVAPDSPSTLQHAPSGALPGSRLSAGTVCSSVFGSAEEDTQAISQSSLLGAPCCYTGLREQDEEDTEAEGSEALSSSEGEREAEAVMADRLWGTAGDSPSHVGEMEARQPEAGPSADVGYLTSALQDCNINTFIDIDKLSTSEVVMFFESCQLKDYSSGDSVSECSSKEERSKELKQSEVSGAKCRRRLYEEWVELEEDYPLKGAHQSARCSLETLSEVLTKVGRQLHTNPEAYGEGIGNFLLLNNQAARDGMEDTAPKETSSPTSHSTELPLPAHVGVGDSSPLSGRSAPEHMQCRPEGEAGTRDCPSTGEEDLIEPGEPLALSSDSAAPPRSGQNSDYGTRTTFQYQISTVTSEVINVLISKDQNLVIEKGDKWTIISGVAITPGMEQVVVCGTPEDAAAAQDQGGLVAGSASVTSVEKSPEALREPPCDGSLSAAHFDKSRLRNRPVKPSIWISSQIYKQTLETENAVSDHTYCNWKLEPLARSKNRSKIASKEPSSKPARTSGLSRGEAPQGDAPQGDAPQGDAPQGALGTRASAKTPRGQMQPIVANADTSTPTDCPDTLSKIRQEVGPPLPPLLAPLIATPPRRSQALSPLISSSSPSSPSSPAGPISPLCEIPVPPMPSPWPGELQQASPPGPSPSPCTAAAPGRVVSSPLQFCAATPKHALPVPGRLPPHAPGRAVGAPQENSVKILDTMYPELSARARTLSLLKGNMQLTRGSADGKVLPGRVSALLGLKAITSTSTAFVKTGGGSVGDIGQGKSEDLGTQQDVGGKRTLSASILRSAKRLRLDSESLESETRAVAGGLREEPPEGTPQTEVVTAEEQQSAAPACSPATQLPLNEVAESYSTAVARALRKIAESCFDLLPVIRSHVYVGNISKKPVMRDQEKEVVYEFSTTNKHLGEYLLRSILSELKIQKMSMDHNYIHALCRVYVGVCRQLGDLERARLFCYSLLKEDFPESEKLTLFVANMWHEVFLSQSVIGKAMQLVARQRARGEVLSCLRAFLGWEKSAPVDVGIMVSKLLLTIQLCPKTEFQSSEEFGEDLSSNTWEYIFAIDLLCCHQRWIWTHDNIISKELWPVMDKWIKYRKGHANIAYTPDVIVASILRLIGRLGQLGLKEGFPSAVKNISSVIGMFIQHAQDEEIPWGVQLAAVYALCDLSPSNPAETSKILEAWRSKASSSVPSAVIRCLDEVGSLNAEASAGFPTAGASAGSPTAGASAGSPTAGASADFPTAGPSAGFPTAGASTDSLTAGASAGSPTTAASASSLTAQGSAGSPGVESSAP
ncbi:little elongation complex subunit 1, partial [Nannospalax galili]